MTADVEHAVQNPPRPAIISRDTTRRLWGWGAFVVALALVYWRSFADLTALALAEDLHSHILLIPFASAYLVWIRARELPIAAGTSPWLAVTFVGLGGGALAIAMTAAPSGDVLFWRIVSFLWFAVAGFSALLGFRWLRATAFPWCFLFFMAPIPLSASSAIEELSKLASAEAANALFIITGTTHVRTGNVFNLPGITLEVATECSGIRSSLVLFISAIFAANLLLSTTWRRVLLVAIVLPLGIIRNGFRIFVIGSLCTHYGPEMVNSPIHHRGGPIFFALSLIPLFAVIWWLRAGEIGIRSKNAVQD